MDAQVLYALDIARSSYIIHIRKYIKQIEKEEEEAIFAYW